MRSLCDAYRAGIDAGVHDSLLLAIMFVFDFLCIHPFDDGNGRMSRLLILLLLCRHGYVVGKYISLEMLVEKNKETYYETLQASSIGWDENRNDLFPFLRYLLGVMLRAYREFAERGEALGDRRMGKAERIRKFVTTTHLGDVSKAQIAAEFPDVSITLIEKTLKGLLDDGLIKKRRRSRNHLPATLGEASKAHGPKENSGSRWQIAQLALSYNAFHSFQPPTRSFHLNPIAFSPNLFHSQR